MVDFRIVLQFVEFILCILYDGVALIVIPDCIEAIAFYAKIVAAVHIDVREQIQGLKLVIVHRVSCLCNRCLQKEWEGEILKGLLISKQIWLHRF